MLGALLQREAELEKENSSLKELAKNSPVLVEQKDSNSPITISCTLPGQVIAITSISSSGILCLVNGPPVPAEEIKGEKDP